MARRFMYVCAGILMLVTSYEIGARKAEAQSASTVAAVTSVDQTHVLVVTQTGDAYYCLNGGYPSLDPVPKGNVFTGAPTASQSATWGQVKAAYRK